MTLFLRLGGGGVATHGARLLGFDWVSDRPLVELVSSPVAPVHFPLVAPFVPRAGRRVFGSEVFVAGARARLEVWWQGDRAWVEVDRLTIGVDLTAGVIEGVDLPAGDELWIEHVLLGPPLLLALAHHGIFGLHAGAARVGDGLLAFLGASGAGKSTLAGSAGEGWQSFADDLLPVEITPDGAARGLGGFPQLKLAPERRRAGEGLALPLRAVILLAGEAPAPTARRLLPAEATAAWVAHTMIARLFSPRLLGAHLAWAGAGTAAVPTYAVRFPRGRERLGEVRAWIGGALGGL